jgi:hypothetical protein
MNATGLWMRLRHTQDAGSGRPDEAVAALAEELGLAMNVAAGEGDHEEAAAGEESAAGGRPTLPTAGAAPTAGRPRLEMVRPVRERLWLSDELSG